MTCRVGLLLAAVLLLGCSAAPPQTGAFRPKILEVDTDTYLPDFSYAGYREGEAPLPEPAATHAIQDFGARADDDQDDTAAFKAALAALANTSGQIVLTLQPGRYILSDILFVERAGFILRGAGSGPSGSVLELRRPLADLPRPQVIQELETYLKQHNKQVDGQPFSPFSWTGGLIWTRSAAPPSTTPALRALEGKRGEHRLRINGATPRVGSQLELRWFNPFGSDSPVLRHVFGLGGRIPGERLADAARVLTTQMLTVVATGVDTITVEQPLRHDVKADWAAELAVPAARLSEVGFEHFRVELPAEPYAGHHKERGYNAFYLTDLRDSFVRDVVIHDSDSAILSDRCDHLTLSRISVTGRAGHYGIHLGDVDSVLTRDFLISAAREHSVSFNTGSRGSVFSRGTIHNASLDQHRGRNHQNLFDAISSVETGQASALFKHGGAAYWGPTHGAFNTFWNIRLDVRQPSRVPLPLRLSGVTDAGPARIVGISANVPLQVDYPGAYLEGLGHAEMAVPSLYDEQLRQRLATRR